MKIDVFCHIFPPKYLERVKRKTGPAYAIALAEGIPTLYDMERRFRIMDKFPDVLQVLTATFPALERVGTASEASDLARASNDEVAELISKHPDRFVAGVANLPLNDLDASLEEIDRCVKELKFKGVQLYTNINGKPLDAPEFLPLYQKMIGYNLPVFLHPDRDPLPDYPGEERSRYGMNNVIGWPYETTIAVLRLIYGGVLERYPDLKIITHHCGGMIPFFAERIRKFYHTVEMRLKSWDAGLTRHPLEYLRSFYYDTAVSGSVPALMCGYSFCGAERMLFGTDAPYDHQLGELNTREAIQSIEQMAIPDLERKMIFEDNTRKLLRLPV